MKDTFKRTLPIWFITLALVCPFLPAEARSASSFANPASPLVMPDGKELGKSGRYIDVNGLKVYYEIHGEGEPLLLLHGDFGNVESLFTMIPALMKRYKVIVPDRRGHGHTNDPPGPYTYALFAEDQAALLKALGIESAFVVGWSGGAATGLYLALGHPEMVRKLVAIGQPFNAFGATYGFIKYLKNMSPENLAASSPMIVESWEKASPEGPDHFPVFFQKMKDLLTFYPDLVREDIRKLTMPVLLMAGQNDIVRLDSMLLFYESLPGNPDPKADQKNRQIAIIPGTTHFCPLEKPDLVNTIIIDFLAGEELKGSEKVKSMFAD